MADENGSREGVAELGQRIVELEELFETLTRRVSALESKTGGPPTDYEKTLRSSGRISGSVRT